MRTLQETGLRSLLLLTALLLSLGPAAQAMAADKVYTIEYAWGTTENEDDPHGMTARFFKEFAEQYSNGAIQVKLLPNGQMGQERDMFEGMQMGTMEAGVYANPTISAFVPEFQVLDLPFIFPDTRTAFEALDGELGKLLFEAMERHKVVGLGFADGGFRQMYNRVRPIRKPEDLQGVKFRVMETPVYISMYKAFGSNPTPMAFGEVFTALQQKTIDGLEIPIPVMHQNKYYEVTRYVSMTNHTYTTLVMAISKKVFDKLPAELQQVCRDAARDAVRLQRERNGANLQKLIDDLKARGMEINEVDDPKAFQEKVQAIYAEYEPSIGPAVMHALKKYTDK